MSHDNARLTIDEVRQRMQKSIDVLHEQLHGISEFGTSSLVETVKVSAYGQKTPLNHLASIETKVRRVTIKLFDPSLVSITAKACSDAGFSAHVFSKDSVVVSLPDLSGDTRDEMKARIKRLGEETKVSVRNIRKLFKQGIPKDLPKTNRQQEENQVQNATDEAVGLIEGIVAKKIAYVEQ